MLYVQYNQQFLGKMTLRMHWERKDIHAQNRAFARSLCFLARNSPSKTTDPHEVCARLLPQMVVKRTMKANFVSYAWRGATPSVYTIHPCKAVRAVDETCVKTVGK